MGDSKTRPTTTTLSLSILMPLLSLCAFSLILVQFHKGNNLITQCSHHSSSTMLPLFCALVVLGLALALVLIAARATMVTWITVLVLLAFAGNRRRVLVKRGRTITNEVAMLLVGVLFKEKWSRLVAVACATVFSLMAVIGIKEAQLISL